MSKFIDDEDEWDVWREDEKVANANKFKKKKLKKFNHNDNLEYYDEDE